MIAAIATWPFGKTAVEVALPLLRAGASALDAAIAGAQAVEDDPAVHSVGFGGIANRIGTVSLDACVMDGATLDCGAAAGVENIRHVAQLARVVMERTPHLFLVGEGARLFAVAQGMPLENLHTPESVAEWLKRHADANAPLRHDPPTEEDHDTVTVLTLDLRGNLAGACSTSGLAHKMPGRVGDSPIIGAGLYVDNEAGAAGATGVGEEVIRIAGSHYIAEQMRAGSSPQAACDAAIRRLIQVAARRAVRVAQVAFIALNRQGEHGAACTKGTNFHYALAHDNGVELIKAGMNHAS